KKPRALIEKLGEVEGIILERIMKQITSVSFSPISQYFWKKHCHAVELIKVADAAGATQQPGYCSDGFKQKSTEIAPWPQPEGIFSKGKELHPLSFLAAFRQLHDKIVVDNDAGELTIEQEALCAPPCYRDRRRHEPVQDFPGIYHSCIGWSASFIFLDQNSSRYLRLDAQ
ncbi:hypothetical protein B0H12DRAFT_1039908, partial [Mycena haematopus]